MSACPSLEAGVVADTGDRLVVVNPLLTDWVDRVVLSLRGWEEPAGADIV